LPPKIVISVSNDLSTDQRVKRATDTIFNMGYDVVLLGRVLPSSLPIKRNYKVKRMKLLFNGGAIFYLELNIRLFFQLMRERPDVQLANDLDTLLANYLYHRLRSKKTKLVYDSHEYFTEVPELLGRRSRSVWVAIERWIFPKLKHAYTVSPMISKIYSETYNVPVGLVRNLPQLGAKKLNVKPLPEPIKLIYQGAVNVNRGIELMVESMVYLPHCVLYIFGDGDVYHDVIDLIGKHGLGDRVFCKGRVDPKQLRSYTEQCQLGLSFEEKMGQSYEFALPNKVFDYIHGHVPVLVSDLTQMKDIVMNYGVGEVLQSRQPKAVAGQITKMLGDVIKYQQYMDNCVVAKQELCWEKEEEVLKKFFVN